MKMKKYISIIKSLNYFLELLVDFCSIDLNKIFRDVYLCSLHVRREPLPLDQYLERTEYLSDSLDGGSDYAL
jgi:hypothetical protein